MCLYQTLVIFTAGFGMTDHPIVPVMLLKGLLDVTLLEEEEVVWEPKNEKR